MAQIMHTHARPKAERDLVAIYRDFVNFGASLRFTTDQFLYKWAAIYGSRGSAPWCQRPQQGVGLAITGPSGPVIARFTSWCQLARLAVCGLSAVGGGDRPLHRPVWPVRKGSFHNYLSIAMGRCYAPSCRVRRCVGTYAAGASVGQALRRSRTGCGQARLVPRLDQDTRSLWQLCGIGCRCHSQLTKRCGIGHLLCGLWRTHLSLQLSQTSRRVGSAFLARMWFS
jgi:hypothetical protein